MSKHKHTPDKPQQSDRTPQAPATGGDQGDLPNRTANTSLTNPGPPPSSGKNQPKASGGAANNLPNRTANTRLTDTGPAPQNPVSGQFGEVGQTGQGTDLTAQMESAGPSSGNVPAGDDLIPWDPTGKIDDEVERRYRKPPAAPQPPPATSAPPAGTAGESAAPQTPPDVPARLGGDPGWSAPQSGTIPRDAGTGPGRYGDDSDGSSADYSGPITSAPADAGQSGVRTMHDVRPAPAPAHGARAAQHPADSGAADEAPNPAPSKAPYSGPHRDPGGYGEVQ